MCIFVHWHYGGSAVRKRIETGEEVLFALAKTIRAPTVGVVMPLYRLPRRSEKIGER
jgi:hypothetical protein